MNLCPSILPTLQKREVVLDFPDRKGYNPSCSFEKASKNLFAQVKEQLVMHHHSSTEAHL